MDKWNKKNEQNFIISRWKIMQKKSIFLSLNEIDAISVPTRIPPSIFLQEMLQIETRRQANNGKFKLWVVMVTIPDKSWSTSKSEKQKHFVQEEDKETNIRRHNLQMINLTTRCDEIHSSILLLVAFREENENQTRGKKTVSNERKTHEPAINNFPSRFNELCWTIML